MKMKLLEYVDSDGQSWRFNVDVDNVLDSIYSSDGKIMPSDIVSLKLYHKFRSGDFKIIREKI